MKVMLAGADSMFSVWLTFFREQLATYVALLVLLPLTLLLNWQLSVVLIVLVILFCAVTIVVINPDRGRPEPGGALSIQFGWHGAGCAGQRHGGAVLHPAGSGEAAVWPDRGSGDRPSIPGAETGGPWSTC